MESKDAVEMTTMSRYSDDDQAPEDDLEMTLPMDHVPDHRRTRGCIPKVLVFVICLVMAIVVAILGGRTSHHKTESSGDTGVESDSGQSGGTEDTKGGGVTPSGGNTEEVEAWLKAPVVLADGKKYEVIAKLEHDRHAFTEGFTYGNGVLYESTGMLGQSSIRTLNETTGEVLSIQKLESTYFGEGLAYVDGKLYQLTYKKKTGFIFNAFDLSQPPETFTFETTTGEGWGLTYDATKKELIATDGSEFLHFWDVDTLEFKRKIEVTRQNKRKARSINELEWWRGRILSNVWFEDVILVIHPETGTVEKEYQFKDLWPKEERRHHAAGVLNGISIARDPDLLYITGKNWNQTFLVKLLY